MNSRKQGDIGTSLAIAYFSIEGYTINIPLSDSQKYDLLLEKEGIFKKVQVKTCLKKNKGSFKVELRTVTNTRGKKFSVSFISSKDCDILFVVLPRPKMYLFPVEEILGKSGLTMNEKYSKFEVNFSLGEIKNN